MLAIEHIVIRAPRFGELKMQRNSHVSRSTVLAAVAVVVGWLAASPPFLSTRAACATEDAALAADRLDRTVLPIPEPKYPPLTELDARKAKAPPRFEVKAPKGAPNVVIVLIDDMGFGQSGAFGG